MDKNKRSYTPPSVLTTEGLLLEHGILTHSVATMVIFDTSAQDVLEMDYASDDAYFEDYNYKWE